MDEGEKFNKWCDRWIFICKVGIVVMTFLACAAFFRIAGAKAGEQDGDEVTRRMQQAEETRAIRGY